MQQNGPFLKKQGRLEVKLLLFTILNYKKNHANKVQVIVNNNT